VAEGRLPELIYLEFDDILELYAAMIGAAPGQARDQIRNRSGIESALARPASYGHYQEADIAVQAAVLAHGLAEGQNFIDGNKRIALVSMLTFLEINGYRLPLPDPELADLILSLGAGVTPEALASRIRAALIPI
jgi:death-on-curing protein